jgi:SAM-dependent methyltransferase
VGKPGPDAGVHRLLLGAGGSAPHARSLEIGCGEGFLLAARNGGEKFAVDLSIEAIRKAKMRADAHYSLALAERLPYSDDYFDLVISVGVMEHFLDTGAALREIRRILRPGGHYVNLLHVELTRREQIGAKTRELLFPRPHPLRLLRWLMRRLGILPRDLPRDDQNFPHQPIQNRFTTGGAKTRLEQCGFTVTNVLHTRNTPGLPLLPWVVIYVAEKMTALERSVPALILGFGESGYGVLRSLCGQSAKKPAPLRSTLTSAWALLRRSPRRQGTRPRIP